MREKTFSGPSTTAIRNIFRLLSRGYLSALNQLASKLAIEAANPTAISLRPDSS